MSFENWRRRLAGEKVTTFLQPQLEDEGYYRRQITEAKQNAAGQNNGQKRIIGWESVAYFSDGDVLYGVIGDRDMTDNEVKDESLWSWVCRHPISEDWYRAVAERGEPWPDLKLVGVDLVPAEGFQIPAANREVAKTDNQPPAEEVIPPVKQHATAISNAVGVAKAAEITDDVTAAQALGIKNRLAELRLAADKAGKAEYEPLYKSYIAVRDQWTPMVKEAKDSEDAINKRYLTFRDQQRKAADKLIADAKAAQDAIDEANERAAQRAIASGEPEAPPVVELVAAPPPAPAPVTATYRAAGQRSVREVETWHFDEITDWNALFEFAKDQSEIRTAMTNMAKAMVKAGRDVPGVKRHFGLV